MVSDAPCRAEGAPPELGPWNLAIQDEARMRHDEVDSHKAMDIIIIY